jgi:hypothetical protein
MRWARFVDDCPELGELATEMIAERHIVLLGSLRADGTPRISALECDVAGDDLYTGMIWQSAKALDLVRDPRMTLHSLPAGLSNPDGDLKLYGRAVDVRDPAGREAYGQVIFARLGWRPDEPYHCFAYDITAAGFVRFADGGRDVWTWREGRGFHRGQIPELGPP